ncbi:MAG TPA: sigma-54 dependent transcriptional regulator [Longimicrobiaceae bacterium]|nr:sigma-54 dependent transcriptional regulator [Longimicrobiaceae bacterium]
MNPTIYIVADDPDLVALITAQLERGRRFVTKSSTRADEALEEIRAEPPDAVVCDLAADGIAFTTRLREANRTLPLIIVTTRGKEAEAERALEIGATDFVTRPVEPKSLETRIRRALDQVPAQELLSAAAQAKFDRHGIVGTHPLVQDVREFVDQLGSVAQVTALLLGESGTGKNMVARAIHGASQQAGFRFVEINCAALPAALLEAELFGYEKGAFTDARQTKRGLVEVADGGTLFLDELGSMPLELQAKLIGFLEGRVFRRIGSTRDQSVQARVIAATNVDLAAEVAKGSFRDDLYHRLNVASQVLPPLRAIRSDIPAIARHFVTRAAAYFGKPVPEIDAEGIERLQRYDWPGNARELRNVIERSMIFSREGVLQVAELRGPAVPAAPGNAVPIPRGITLEEVERMYIQATLRDVGGSINAAAQRLGVSRKVLWQRRKRYGISGAPA